VVHPVGNAGGAGCRWIKRNLTSQELRASIKDGSIAGLTQWRSVSKGDIIFVAAGTIHAIGAGIVLAEIQQHSDTTFRLFDYGRRRQLHEDSAVAVSDRGPIHNQAGQRRLTAARTALIASQHFVLERIDLAANSNWSLHADRETWILVIEGHARIGSISASVGDAVFAEADCADIEVGPARMSGLIAYPGPDPIMPLLQELEEQMTKSADRAASCGTKPNEIVEAQI
jgi:mannose-6-phosphate isomerase